MKLAQIRGYCDRPNVRPGETLDFFVGSPTAGTCRTSLVRLIHGDRNPDGPGYKEALVAGVAAGELAVGPQFTQLGGHVVVPDPTGLLAGTDGLTLHLHLWATLPALRQGVISRWCEASGEGWALCLEDGRLVFVVGDGRQRSRVASSKPLFPETWYSVVARIDLTTQRITLSQVVTLNSVNSRFGRIVDLDSDASETAALAAAPSRPAVPLVVAGLAATTDDTRVVALYNGKIDGPRLWSRALSDAECASLHAGHAVPGALAHWDFAAGTTREGIGTDAVTDVSGHGFDGRCVNQPDRGMTGWNWDGREEHFVHCPEQYGALWFHQDSLDDSRWRKSLSLEIPADLPSGCYALKLEQGADADRVPFFVVPPQGTATARIAVVIPTFSYLAYANSQVLQNAAGGQCVMGVLTTLDDLDLELNVTPEHGLSTYDYHRDGRGVAYTSWRRPILNLRPDYRHEFGAVWQFPADLHLVDWLTVKGFAFDVITDHDLHVEGAALLRRYAVVISPSHAEYTSVQMLDAYEQYFASGGRGMYLGANGFYWIASQHPEKPWLIEVRKGESGDQAWRARPGELHHSTTGERGGIWRHRARPPQKLWGTGYTAHGLEVSAGYCQLPDARDPRLAWIVEGIDASEVIGDFGLVNGGAAGLEMDRIDYALGTPPNTMLLASSHGHTASAMLVPEEQYFAYPGMTGRDNPLVRADIAYLTTRQGGAVFAASSMAWCGSLSWNGYANNVSRMTENVLRRFAEDGPLDEVV
ncbi:MAG: N,N-dimethylformamidase beta subunit family domain-containing protein [Gammaproteobacteria bacterium]